MSFLPFISVLLLNFPSLEPYPTKNHRVANGTGRREEETGGEFDGKSLKYLMCSQSPKAEGILLMALEASSNFSSPHDC